MGAWASGKRSGALPCNFVLGSVVIEEGLEKPLWMERLGKLGRLGDVMRFLTQAS
jgi:hypothetical protein